MFFNPASKVLTDLPHSKGALFMDSLTREDIKTLIETQGEWCVSLFMPTVRAGAEVQQNPIRFKNLLRNAGDRLSELGMRVPDIEDLLQPAQSILDDLDLWRGNSDGLAVFAASDQMKHYYLPASFDELVIVERRFHIKPLLPLLSHDDRFYILAISQEHIRLLEGTRYSVDEIELVHVPDSLTEALQYDEYRRLMRTAGSGGAAILHGGGEQEAKLEILRYFQIVDRGLRDLLTDKKSPLVLAGVDYLLPLYREANTYNYLLGEALTGNPETLSAKDLHQRAWQIVKPYFEQEQEEYRALYAKLAGRDEERATDNIKQIVQSAQEGRIAALFVPHGVQQWGVYRAHSHNVHVHPTHQPGDQDLFDLAAAQTFVNGGVVYVVDPDRVPGGGLAAAILRY
jgi:hypothetical protein